MCRLCSHEWKHHDHWREGSECTFRDCQCEVFIETRIGVMLYRFARKVIAA